MTDKNITCAECGENFVFTVRDQEWYQDHGFQPPRRCLPCRQKRRALRTREGDGAIWDDVKRR